MQKKYTLLTTVGIISRLAYLSTILDSILAGRRIICKRWQRFGSRPPVCTNTADQSCIFCTLHTLSCQVPTLHFSQHDVCPQSLAVLSKELPGSSESCHASRIYVPQLVHANWLLKGVCLCCLGEDYLAYNKRRWGSDSWTQALRREGRPDGAAFKCWQWWPATLQVTFERRGRRT